MVGLGKVSITNTGMMKMSDKMRLKDYYYWEQHVKVARGGMI